MFPISTSRFAVDTVGFADVANRQFDLGIFASGYEERCTHCPSRLSREHFDKVLILDFSEKRDHEQRRENNAFFAESWSGEHLSLSMNEDAPVYEFLRTIEEQRDREYRILIDYSSMSRLWYAALLNWARTDRNLNRVSMSFVYSLGAYRTRYAPLVINDILAIPGCEGLPDPYRKTAAVFCLGYDGESTLTVFDKLEADYVYAVIANPGVSSESPQTARQRNRDFLNEKVELMEMPLRSVDVAYWKLGELVSVHRSTDNIVILPMGPKPHVLATILLAMQFPEITLLRVSGRRYDTAERLEPVAAQGEVIVTDVSVTNYAD